MRNATRLAGWTLALLGAGTAHAAESELEGDGAVSPQELGTLRKYFAAIVSARAEILDLKYIEPDATGDNAGWGVNYKWNTSKAVPRFVTDRGDFVLKKLTYDLGVQGSYAFADTTNNADLSTVNAAVRMERGNFGKLNVKQAVGDALQRCLLAIPAATEDAQERRDRDRQMDRCIVDNGVDTLVRNESNAWYYWLDFHGGVEGNQDYSDSRTLFGLSGSYAFQPDERLSRFNVLDLPFRLLRDAFSDSPTTGGKRGYTAPFPSLLLSVDRLDASDDETRKALTSKATYTRASAEIAFNTIVASIDQQAVRFTLSYRYFHEFSAPLAIEAAGLDKFDYSNASLRFPARLLPWVQSDDYELHVAYTTGRLPFDQTSDKAFELGISTNFKWLADRIAQ